MERVVVYIDGFNLYYGLRSCGWRRYYWLDLHRLSQNLLRPQQVLAAVHYFTARISPEPGDPDKPVRQSMYLEALATLPDLQIHYGYYVAREQRCLSCGATWRTYEEKMTDVNIAVELLSDAQDDAFDTAIVISGDGDLASPVRAIRDRYPEKRAIVAFPPRRHSAALRGAADGYFTVGRNVCRDSQFPDHVAKADGYVLTRPQRWK